MKTFFLLACGVTGRSIIPLSFHYILVSTWATANVSKAWVIAVEDIKFALILALALQRSKSAPRENGCQIAKNGTEGTIAPCSP